MTYIATYYLRGHRDPLSRTFRTLNGALRFQVRAAGGAGHFPDAIVDHRGRTIASHEWLLDHRAGIERVLDENRPPSDYGPVRGLLE